MARGGRSARRGLILAAALAAAGCADPAFLDAAARYSATAEAAADAYADVSARYAEAVRSEGFDRAAAGAGVPFVDRAACVPRTDGTAALSDCRVTLLERGGPPGAPLAEAGARPTLDALVGAMRAYAAALGELARGAAEDEAAFRAAAGALEGALARMEGAAGRAAPGAAFPEGVPGAVAALVAEAGALWLEAERVALLREIVPRSDPAVQAATETLRTAHALMMGGAASQRFEREVQPRLERAQAARARGDAAARRETLAELDAAVRAHREVVAADVAAHLAFARLGEAHAALAEAAARDDPAAWRRALERIAEAGEALAGPLGTLAGGG